MSTFKYYNIQILPLNIEGEMIGAKGYRSVFQSLKELVTSTIEKKSTYEISHELRNDFFIAPINVNIKDDIAYGVIMKFDQVIKVFGTLDDEEKFTSKGGDSSKKYKFRFVFDFDKHILAIENNKGLPTANVLQDILKDILKEHANNLYPEHYIKIIEMTNSQSLEKVMSEAESYKRVQVEVTFSNSQDWSDELADMLKTEKEMRDKRIDSITHIEKAADKSIMSEPTIMAKIYLKLACKFGNANIRYKNKFGKTETYKMADSPILLPIKEDYKLESKSELDFALDVKASINQADQLAIDAKKIFKKLREGFSHGKDNK